MSVWHGIVKAHESLHSDCNGCCTIQRSS